MRANAAPDTQAVRSWQRRALVRYLAAKPRDFLTVATPGSGKTAFALRVAGELLAGSGGGRPIVAATTDQLKARYDGRDWLDGHQGDFLYVPPGGVHGFRNDADEPASILMLFAPGAPRERYLEDIGQLADLTDAERREWFIRHDSFFIE